MPTYKHDIEALRALAASFDAARRRFESLVAAKDQVTSTFGSSELGEAYDGFATGWSHKREDLAKAFDSAGASLRDIAQAYADQDRQLVEAATPEGPK